MSLIHSYQTFRSPDALVTPAQILVVLPLVLAGPSGHEPLPEGPARIRREAVAMGTRLIVTVDARSRAEALGATEAAVDAVKRVDALLTTWDRGSVLSRLNAAPLGQMEVPPSSVSDLLAKAEAWARRTGRAFDPSVGALIDAWDLRGVGRRPDAASLAAALESTGIRGIHVDPVTGSVVRFRESAWLDSGGFGKGAALEAAGAALRARGIHSATVDLGGQVLAVGSPRDDPEGWRVAVAHPIHRDRAVVALRLRSVSAATTGASERGVTVDGERLGHVVDPRTGLPVPAWGSVTVVTDDPVEADILATALFVMGPDEALAWARKRPSLAVLVLESTNAGIRPRWTLAMERWLSDGRSVSQPST